MNMGPCTFQRDFNLVSIHLNVLFKRRQEGFFKKANNILRLGNIIGTMEGFDS